jgi:hypothetical protein
MKANPPAMPPDHPSGVGAGVGVRMRSVAVLRQRRNSCRLRPGWGQFGHRSASIGSGSAASAPRVIVNPMSEIIR